MTRAIRSRAGLSAALVVSLATIAAAQTAPRPAVGAERAFAPPPRVERTLANGLKVVVARFATVPKVSVSLRVR